ncbi:MAG: hypothetical protein JWO83_3662 [Caulobacteraceae bacterium]|jgi:hypothetical protein|nr:hypothetical protein [Caulobacteraceae bacterium]
MKGIYLAAAVATGAVLCGFAAFAEPPPFRSLRLIGAAPDAHDPVPAAFVIDARLKPGDGEFQTTLEGWFAAVAAPAASGEVSGSCVEKHCALTVDLDGAKLALTGDFGDAAGPVPARYVVKDDQDKSAQNGAATLTPLGGAVPGLGALAAPGAIDQADFDDLLMWAHETVSAGSAPTDPVPGSFQHESLATWQQAKGRLATGLIFAADLDQLRAERAAAAKDTGWTPLGDAAHGWSGGYPAALLPKTDPAGAEQRWASADGKARLVIAIDPPMSSDAFDAFVDTATADRTGRNHVNTTRVNGDLEYRFEEDGVVTVGAYHNREGGLARLVLTYPADRGEAFEPFEVILQRQFKAGDDLKR